MKERKIDYSIEVVVKALNGSPCPKPGCDGVLVHSNWFEEGKLVHKIACSSCGEKVPLRGKGRLKMVYKVSSRK